MASRYPSRGGRRNFNGPNHGRGRGRGRGVPRATVFGPQPPYPPFPDPDIEQRENAVLSSSRVSQSIQPRFPTRPGFGTRGREIVLWANYFELTGYGDLVLYRYSIAISADRSGKIPSKKLKRIVEILLVDHLGPHRPDVVTDYKSTILSKHALDVPERYDVVYRNEEEEHPPPRPTVYHVQLRQTAALSTSELLDYVTSTRSAEIFGSKEALVQALNIVIGHHPKAASSITSVGANTHYGLSPTDDRFDLGAGLQAIRGFFTSVRLATSRVLVNVQVKHTAFYAAGPLPGLMQAFVRENGQNKARLQRFLKGLSVSVTHLARRGGGGRVIPRIKRIAALANRDDGAQQQNPPIVPELGAGPMAVKFFLAGGPETNHGKDAAKGDSAPGAGQYVSVYDFFQRAYNITIRDASLPVVNVGSSSSPTYLPAQVCEVRVGQLCAAKLSPSQTQNMIRFAVRSPDRNARSITATGLRLVGLNPQNDTLANFGATVDSKLLSVAGRVLDCPTVLYQGSGATAPRFGSWNLQRVRLATTTELPCWTYLAISFRGRPSPWGSDGGLVNQVAEFTKKLNEVGIRAARCTPGMHLEVDAIDAASQVSGAIHRFTHTPNRPPPKLLLIILPTNGAALYNSVKCACDVVEGLVNVCAVASKFMKPNNDQYFANVALKVNLKLGGNNHTLESSKLGMVAKGQTIVFGLDVTHPSPGSAKSAPSVAAIVASVDRWLGQWPGELHILPPRQEMVNGLEELVKTRLRIWLAMHKTLPENILVYRDGVSEGQYAQVLDIELPAFRTACRTLYPADQSNRGIPHITIVVVGKRHNTRFYPTKTEDADRSSNPPNGTVVDRGVTEAHNWDFFLQAHTAIQGTARPAHYFVVVDEIFRRQAVRAPLANGADALEDFTHNLCYLFGRATKAVSICPPAYYADLLCERGRCYLSGLFDPDAADTESNSTRSTQTVDLRSAVRVHPNVRDSMFYL